MTSMDDVAPRSRPARLLAVLALIVGLLAMHGVASAHHAAATPAPPHVSAADARATHPHVVDSAAGVVAATQQAARARAGPADPACQGECPTAAAGLCVIVLTGAALGLLLRRRRRRRTAPLRFAPAPLPSRSAAPPVRHARGPDPVRELCVSRT